VNRRSFLSMMGFVAPAVIVKPTYFFAPRDGWGIKIYSTIGAWADYTDPGAYDPIQLIGQLIGSNANYHLDFLSRQLAYRMGKTVDTLVANEYSTERRM
jgi:hypothetical protein